MKSFVASLFVVLIGLSFAIGDAEAARRLGGGKSIGMQRDSVKPAAPPAAATPAAQPQGLGAPAAAAAATPKRSWMGPLAGLAAGLGLAALASHFGFGEELANFLMIGLLVLAAIVVLRLIFRKKQDSAPMQYAGAAAGNANAFSPPAFGAAGSAPTPARSTGSGRIPEGFDVETFTRQAKLNFIRLQAANDAGNLDDIREFTAPEMFAEIKLDIDERAGAIQHTDVVMLNAEVLEVVEEPVRYIVSVRFHGLLREERDAAATSFDEIWHLSKPVDGSRGWQVAGIQQTQ